MLIEYKKKEEEEEKKKVHNENRSFKVFFVPSLLLKIIFVMMILFIEFVNKVEQSLANVIKNIIRLKDSYQLDIIGRRN